MRTFICDCYCNLLLPGYRVVCLVGMDSLNKVNAVTQTIGLRLSLLAICDKTVKGDEIHFTFECDRSRDIRQKYYIPTSFTDSNSNKHQFVKLLQSNDVDLLIKC